MCDFSEMGSTWRKMQGKYQKTNSMGSEDRMGKPS